MGDSLLFFFDNLADLLDFKLARNNLLRIILWLAMWQSFGKPASIALDDFLEDFFAADIIDSYQA